MCPGTLAIAAVASGAAGNLMSGIASGNAANYQAAVASHNATIAMQNAGYSAAAGSARAEEAGLKARAQSAGVKAGLAANGLDVNTGSAADVQTSQREIGALDTATVANQAAEAVYGYRATAAGDEAQAQLYSAEAPVDYLGGVLQAGGSVAKGLSDLPGGGGGGAGGAPPSLLSGAPQNPSQYQWMGSPNWGQAAGYGDYEFG